MWVVDAFDKCLNMPRGLWRRASLADVWRGDFRAAKSSVSEEDMGMEFSCYIQLRNGARLYLVESRILRSVYVVLYLKAITGNWKNLCLDGHYFMLCYFSEVGACIPWGPGARDFDFWLQILFLPHVLLSWLYLAALKISVCVYHAWRIPRLMRSFSSKMSSIAHYGSYL